MEGKPLAGQVALVTGAAKRVGRSIALRLAAEGVDLVINYESSKPEAQQLVEEIKASGRRALAVQGDVSQRSDVQKLFAATEAEFKRLDILVNNAGMFFAADFEQLTEEQWDRILNTNLKSQFLCCQTAAPIMKRQGRGRIINISSLGGLLPWPAYTHYCVSKAGSIMLTKCLARALGPEITVNSVAPGTIQFPGEKARRGLHPQSPATPHRHGRRNRPSRPLFRHRRLRHRPNPRRRRRSVARIGTKS